MFSPVRSFSPRKKLHATWICNVDNLLNGQISDISYNWNVVLYSEFVQNLEDECFRLKIDVVRSIYSQILRFTVKIFQLGKLPAWNILTTNVKFGNKCFSRHQFQDENIHLIDSERTQNKEKLFNYMKCHYFICSNVFLDKAVFVIQRKCSKMANILVY